MKSHLLLFLAMLIHVAACGSSTVPTMDGATEQSDTAADADLRASETAPIDRPQEQPGRDCLEFPGCPKLIYDQTGCPVACDVGGSNADAGSGAG